MWSDEQRALAAELKKRVAAEKLALVRLAWADPHGASRAKAVSVPVFLEAGAAPHPGGLPIGGQTRVNLPNDHLQYAITWFALAVGLAVIYVVYHLRRPERPLMR